MRLTEDHRLRTARPRMATRCDIARRRLQCTVRTHTSAEASDTGAWTARERRSSSTATTAIASIEIVHIPRIQISRSDSVHWIDSHLSPFTLYFELHKKNLQNMNYITLSLISTPQIVNNQQSGHTK